MITKSAAAALGSKTKGTVPDDAKFDANADHPEVILSYATAGNRELHPPRVSTTPDGAMPRNLEESTAGGAHDPTSVSRAPGASLLA
jgi:hypothetical protein